jgi:hypothetical protein
MPHDEDLSAQPEPDHNNVRVRKRTLSPNEQGKVPTWLVPTAFVIGIAFVLLVLFLVVWIPNPTESQFTVFRIVISLGSAAFSIALTGFLSIKFRWARGGELVAGGALAVFAVVYFASPTVPMIPKPQPLVDAAGHLLESPANRSEMEVIRIQDEIEALRQYKETVQYPTLVGS